MSEWLLYFFAGAGALCLAFMAFITAALLKREKSQEQFDLAISNLRRECLLLEQMCDANKTVSNKQMDAVVHLSGLVKMMDNQVRNLGKQVQELHDQKKTSPE